MQLTYIGVVVTTILFWIQEARGDPDDDNSTSTNCPGGCLYDGDMNSITCIDSGCERFPVGLIENDIVRIDVSYNAITSVPKLVYPQLTYLDLSNNAITKIDEHTFSSCPELQHLNLSVNVLTIITSYMFKMDLGNTLELDLSNNRISFIEMNSFLFMHKLAKLNISHNNLAYLNNSAINQNALTILDLEDNLFTEVDMHYFQDLSYLQYMSLRKNAIHAIEEDSFTNLDHLQWLDLGENQLEDLLENIFHEGLRHPFSELQKIHLDRNCLKTIHDKTFSPFPKLKYIFLDDNDLRSIGSDQPFPESLTKVSLRRNLALISIRNGTFSGLKELQTVDISGCYKLTEIEPGAFDEERSSVSQFDASQCGLFHLSASLLNWKNVTELDLSGNPWDCDCDLTWPKSTLETETLTNMLCSTPHQLKGQSLDDLDVETMSCAFYSRYRHSIGVGLIMAATVVFILATALLAYTYRKRLFRKGGSARRGTYHTLYNTVDDSSDPTVSIQVDGATADTSLLNNIEPTAV